MHYIEIPPKIEIPRKIDPIMHEFYKATLYSKLLNTAETFDTHNHLNYY
jgi:hypothetical protein